MSPLMLGEVRAISESLSTFATLVGLLTSVDSEMYSEVGDVSKGFPTLITSIWLLPCMSSLMQNQG